MSRLWDKEWFKYLCMSALTLAVIVAFAVATPQKQNNASAKDDEMQIAAAGQADESEGNELPEPEQEECLSVEFAAAKWVDGEIVPMTNIELAEFEELLYSSKTKQEYREVMRNIAYYNKVIDMKRFEWYKGKLKDN